MKILYFTKDYSPENLAFAKAHGMIIRAADAIESAVNVESCDFVYGEVPAAYRVFPEYTLPETSDTELAAKDAELTALKDELAKRDNTIAALQKELDEAKAQLEALQSAEKQPEKGKGK